MLPYLGIILPPEISVVDVGTYADAVAKVLYEDYFRPTLDTVVTKAKEILTATIPNSVKGFFTWLGTSIYNAIIYVIDQFIGLIEWLFNTVRAYLPYAIMISVAWFMTSSVIGNPNVPLWKKVLYPIISPILGIILGELFSALVPERISLPRISTKIKPIVTETPISTITLFTIYKERAIATRTLYSTSFETAIATITLYGKYTTAESLIESKTLYGVYTTGESLVATRTLYAVA
mgnify:CR=1 FL=1